MTGIEFLERVGKLEFPSSSEIGWTIWERNSRALASALLANRNPEEFLRESSVTATMFVGTGAAFTKGQLRYLSEVHYPLDLYAMLSENDFGNPQLLEPPWDITSGSLVNQLYHLTLFEESTGVQLRNLDSIIEIGGGYGACCMMAYRMGFDGRYTILDLPVQSLMQEYYLSNVPGRHRESTVTFTTNDYVLDKKYSLLIALDSLSEIREPERTRMTGMINADSFLIHYMDTFDDIDNHAWVKKFTDDRPVVDWRNTKDQNIPNSNYLVGERWYARSWRARPQ